VVVQRVAAPSRHCLAILALLLMILLSVSAFWRLAEMGGEVFALIQL
jgi:hypothetical protein